MKTLFYNWVPKWLEVYIWIILLACVTLNTGISSGVSVYITGSLSAIPADVTMASYAYSIGIVTAIPLVLRLSQFIPGKTSLTSGFIILILVNLIFFFTDQPLILVMGSFVFGFVKIIIILEILSQMLPILMPKGERYQLYAVYYFATLFFPQISTWMLSGIADNLPWQFGHILNIAELLVGLIIIPLCFHNELLGRKVPLYQIDWPGTILFGIFLLLVDYILSYGQTDDWLNSKNILWAFSFAVVSLYLLLARTILFRRPVLDFSVFKYKNVRMGIFTMFLIGLFFSTSGIQSILMAFTFRNNPVETSIVNLYNIPGFIAGNIFCFFYYKYFNNSKLPIAVTFTCFIISYVILYFIVGQTAGPSDFYLPMFFRGAGTIIAYTSLGIYLASNITFREFFSAILFNLAFRNYLGPAFWGSVLSNYYYRATIKNTNLLASRIDRLSTFQLERFNNLYNSALARTHNINEAQNIATQSFFRQIQTQASLLVIREIFGFAIIVGLIMLIGILISHFYYDKVREPRLVIP